MNSEKSFLKVVVIGEKSVGKTSLVKRYIDQRFSIKEKGTYGFNVNTKEVTVDDIVVTLQIWDTAGQERFSSLSRCFYRDVDCCMLVFDVTSRASFNTLDRWRDEFLMHANPQDPAHFPFIVVGNKVDLGNRIVSIREVNEWFQRNNNIPYYDTSAKEGTNLDLAFQTLFWNALKVEAYSNEGSHFFDTISLKFPDNYREKSKEN